MAVIPTIFPRFVQFVTRMLGLAAVPTVMFDRFMEVMIGPFCPVQCRAGLEKEKCLRNGFEKPNFGLWYFPAAAEKALHSKTCLVQCIMGGGCTLSVGREVKMEIPDRSDSPKSWGKIR